jgi:hypothetical protein
MPNLLIVNVDDRFASVGSTIGANVIRHVVFAAVFALRQLFQCQNIVGTALVPAGFGMALFW